MGAGSALKSLENTGYKTPNLKTGYWRFLVIADEPEEATRNFAEGPPCDPLTRAALLLPWEPCDLTHVDCNQAEPSEEFLRSGRKEESLPDTSVAFGPVPTDRKLKVFSEYRYVNEHLTHPSFELTDDEREADILWYNYHFKNYG
ncbi:hypothetical protein ISCGN_006743 [Ixodes scapularis]